MTFLRRVSELSLRDGGEEFGHLGGILGRAASPLLQKEVSWGSDYDVDGDLLTTNQLYDLTIYYCLLLILKVETLQGKHNPNHTQIYRHSHWF